MNHTLLSLAALIVIAPHPYSCHKTTGQESYADSRRCFAALDANLSQVSPAQFRAAGINGDSVEFAARQTISAAFDSGEALGMKPGAIYADLHKAAPIIAKRICGRRRGRRGGSSPHSAMM